jgi:hypothetical protein
MHTWHERAQDQCYAQGQNELAREQFPNLAPDRLIAARSKTTFEKRRHSVVILHLHTRFDEGVEGGASRAMVLRKLSAPPLAASPETASMTSGTRVLGYERGRNKHWT